MTDLLLNFLARLDMYVNGVYNPHEKKKTLMLHFIQYISTDDSCLLEKLSSVNPNIKSVMSEKAFPVQWKSNIF